MRNTATAYLREARRPPLVVGVALLCLLAAACSFVTSRDEPTCRRLPIPAFPVGANVLDRADDQDADPTNDGTRGLGSEASFQTLDRLAALGLDSVVLPVSLHMRDRSSTDVRPGPLLRADGRARLGRMIDAAHARGMIAVLAPHLVLDDGDWRGYLEPSDVDGFFRSYTHAVSALADVGERHCAEVLSAGTELKSLSKDPRADEGFRHLVERLRARFSGELTYAANWDEVETVRHWALFDFASLNAFRPLAHEPGADDETLRAGALANQRALEPLARQTGRPVWFLEVGFKTVPETHLRPWEWPTEVNASALPYDEEAQARAYRAITWALHNSDAVGGAFFWMVPSDPNDDEHPWRMEPPQGFGFLGKPAEEVVRALAREKPQRP